jgi:hypothetical protein
MKVYRAFPVFSAVFPVLYLAVTYFNLALITYFPTQGELHVLVQRAKDGPSMFWYGWILTAGLGATAVSALSLTVPERIAVRVSPVWIGVIAVCVMLVFVYLLRGWFLPSVGLILK